MTAEPAGDPCPSRRWGWHYRPDHRDTWRPAGLRLSTSAPPPRASLRDRLPPPWDQGRLGSCTAHAVAALWCVETGTRNKPAMNAIYWAEHAIEGGVHADWGAYLRDAIKVLAAGASALGAPPDSAWPYSDADPGQYQQRPPDDIWARAVERRLGAYHRVQDLQGLRDEIAAGHPVAFGFTVPAGFDWSTKTLQRPPRGTKTVGGHAVAAVGYDDALGLVDVRGSWGPWSNDGTGHFQVAYDFWEDPDWVAESWAARRAA